MFSSFIQDIAELSKTSTISVFFNICLVVITAMVSPFQEEVYDSGGIFKVIQKSSLHPQTLFVGFGVLSFAFVCQDASFIIAGSLDNTKKKKWGKVTRSSLLTCFMLTAIIGVTGYLGFQEETKGNILNSFHHDDVFLTGQPIFTQKAIFLARLLLGSSTICVYPLASYIARHVLIVLLFSGRHAHEGDDHIVLARFDRRVFLTLSLYVATMVPALLCEDLGLVLGLTGAIGGSCLSYVGPGAAYLAIYSEDFFSIVRKKWEFMRKPNFHMWKYPCKSVEDCETEVELIDMREDACGTLVSLIYLSGWYILFMPLWCTIASIGYHHFEEYQRKIAPILDKKTCQIRMEESIHQTSLHENSKTTMPLLAPLPACDRGSLTCAYNAVNSCNIETKRSSILVVGRVTESNTNSPSSGDFLLAVALIILGFVAFTAGIYSISVS